MADRRNRIPQVDLPEGVFDVEMGRRHPLKILLVEDNANNRKLVLRLLERLGYQAEVAINGLEALESLRCQSHDVVLMDLQMPEMDGFEATRIITQEWPKDRRPRLIAMTPSNTMEVREACLVVGMDDFVGKPVQVSELVGALKKSCPLGEPAAPAGEQPQVVRSEKVAEPVSTLSSPGSDLQDRGTDGGLNPVAWEGLLAIMGDEDSILDLIETFLEVAPWMLRDMEEAEKKGDLKGILLAAHYLKSNSAELGATRLTRLCRDLEKKAKRGVLNGVLVKLTQARSEYERVRRALLEVFEKNSTYER
ncbi:MAG: response regulator [Syntrophobacterales bacterium]|jgi:CheY-like chemotaxis protein